MFLIWFAAAGLVIGLLRGGRISRLAELRLRGTWLVFLALVIQVLIFPWGDRDALIEVGVQYLHVISYLPLLGFVYLNRRYWEILLMGLGMALNLVVIVANGGYMPVSPFALEQAGESQLARYLQEHRVSGNVVVMGPDTRLNFLGDVLFLPPTIPFAAAFSIGDLLLGLGIASFLATRMLPSARRDRAEAIGRRFFVELLEKLSHASSIPEIAETAIKYALSLIPNAKRGSFLWWDNDRGVYKYVAAVGWDLEALQRVEFRPEELLQERVSKGSTVVVIRHPWELHRKCGHHEILRRFGDASLLPKAFISVPIEYKGRAIGYFNIDSDDPDAFSEEDLTVMQDFKQEIETALALKLGQEELRESEERFRTLFERAPDAIYITDLEGNILDCNEAATKQTGYTKEELLRMNIVRDLTLEGGFNGYFNEKLKRGETVIFEEKKVRKDGSVFYTEVAISPIVYKGKEAALSFNRDITWRKQQEEKMLKLWRLSRDLFMSRESEDICQKAASLCRELLDAEYCGIYLRYEDGYKLASASGGKVAREELPPYLETEEDVDANNNTMAIPLSFEGERLGLFVVKLKDKGAGGLRVLVELLALQVANVLQVMRYTQKLEEFADRLEKLHHAVTRFNQAGTEKELCDIAVELLEGLLGFDYCELSLREGDYLVPVSRSSKMPASLPRPFRLDEGLGGLTYREQRTFWGDDVRKCSAAKPVSPDFRAFISTPVGDYGIIQIVSTKEGAFSPEDVKLVEIVAQQLYEALKRVRLEREIRDQAVKDPLTGLYNRRYYDLFIQLHLKELEGKPLGIAILDMDNFKAVNDLCGHVVGDKVLVELARILQDNVRDDDVVIRWGGDEFLILMPGATREEAVKVVERLREAVSRWSNNLCPGVQVEITAGVSSWDPEEGRDLEEALKEADRELYARKKRRE
ncbi:diguanylate cyclase [Candidatus Bipolaricaulota sp. J31]